METLPLECRVSPAEIDFLREKAGRRGVHYISGMLGILREEGWMIEEVYQDALSQSDQDEHFPHYAWARDFLITHAKEFNIQEALQNPS